MYVRRVSRKWHEAHHRTWESCMFFSGGDSLGALKTIKSSPGGLAHLHDYDELFKVIGHHVPSAEQSLPCALRYGTTLVHAAAARGLLAAVRILITYHADVDEKNITK